MLDAEPLPTLASVVTQPESGVGGSIPEKKKRPIRRIVMAVGAIAILTLASVAIYQKLPEELAELRAAAAAAQPLVSPHSEAVVGDAPDVAEVRTRVMLMDGGKAGGSQVVSLARPVACQDLARGST